MSLHQGTDPYAFVMFSTFLNAATTMIVAAHYKINARSMVKESNRDMNSTHKKIVRCRHIHPTLNDVARVDEGKTESGQDGVLCFKSERGLTGANF